MITSQKCCRCNKQLKITSFYTHRLNKAWNLHDCICRDCVKKLVTSKETMQEYCKLSNRNFREDLWEWCVNKVDIIFEHDLDFNSLEEKDREKKRSKRIFSTYFSQMNQSQYYEITANVEKEQFVENNDTEIIEEDDNEDLELVVKGKEKKIWSETWQGSYSRANIKWLDAYYADTCNDFSVVSRIHQDYAKKIAKASLAMDIAYNDSMNNVAGADKKFEKSKTIFDTLSISAKFSEKTRGQNDVSGFGSLSEIVMQLENTGFLQKKITYSDDDIEKIGADLRWVLSSVSGDL